MKVVVSINPDGTTLITTPVVQTGETEESALERVLLEIPGGEPLSVELVQALRMGDKPANTRYLIDPDSLRDRLAPAILKFTSLPDTDARKQKWRDLLNTYLPSTRTTLINLNNPATQGLIQSLIADDLLTPEQGQYVLSPLF